MRSIESPWNMARSTIVDVGLDHKQMPIDPRFLLGDGDVCREKRAALFYGGDKTGHSNACANVLDQCVTSHRWRYGG
ncbi:MAG: hypothetical protein CMQ05_09555 [Gammaproteobacteria bacterium]|nr:hypothetical protein [Gammaproteobacteria bacterium]RPG26797.1 MAG: hypothetical protein CBC10_002735 [Gammaproteobacteria bacterium TMED50]